MNDENRRLQTFNDWPGDSVVSPQRIAKAGFYATKQGLEVECFSCHLKISTWEYGDQVMARHKILNPSCLFVRNPSDSGNIPSLSLSGQSQSTTVYSNGPDYQNEAVRLATFENWPASNIVTPERLARAGFYYLKDGDNTKCAFCKGVARAWEMGDDPDYEHKRHFPSCPFVNNTIIPRLNVNPDSNNSNKCETNSFHNVNIVGSTVDGNLDELGVQKHNGPKRSDYATFEARLRSFSQWSPNLIQTPEILSQAGFYYEGLGDQVRCFHCDGGLRHWDPDDDPWTEHARWFPRCSFVKLVKGQDFVTACALDHTNQSEQNDKIQSARRRREVSERELQEHMISPAALAALGIGINVERVKRAIKEKLETTGKGYSQPDALVEAALNMQLEEEDLDDSAHNSQIRNSVTSVLNDITQRRDQQPDRLVSNSQVPAMLEQKTSVSLEEENRILREARLCKICMDAEVGIVFLPCGHLATCVNCAPNLEDCPVCRCAIKATVRTFLS
ncbi:baculoviral IAP repeat-containing protein 7-B [Cylas formicarius]|uniref:baculoviral IAP repeat-containing protein 7-B n=1 Tax=Cylas formicarius TaxID=197179 RepID=UPI002958D26C|nr:baculoviral IAP repeat-containing protein 7-B [Cylas formicarius]